MAKRLKTYRVDEDLDAAVTAKAAANHETVTDVITRALREYVKDEFWVHEATGIKVLTDDRMPSGHVALVGRDADGKPSVAVARISSPDQAPPPRRCMHQGTRIIGGWCPQCDHKIKPGGLWA